MRFLIMIVLLLASQVGTVWGEEAPAEPPTDESKAVEADEQRAADVEKKEGSTDEWDVTITVTESYLRDPIKRDVYEASEIESAGLSPAYSFVNEEAMERQGSKSVIDALKYLPGAWTEARGRKVKQFYSTRGQRYPYANFAVDGVWQREFHETPYFLQGDWFERIEVMRSSGALVLGPAALAGHINLIPWTPKEQETRVATEYGSHNDVEVNVRHGNDLGDVAYAVGASHRHYDGPEHQNALEEISNFYGRVVAKPSERLRASVTLLGIYGQRRLGLAEEPADLRFRTELSRFDPFFSGMAVGRVRYEINDMAATEFMGSFTQRDHNYSSEDPLTPLSHRTTKEMDYETTASIKQLIKPSTDNTLRFGGLFNQWVAPEGKRFYSGSRNDLETWSAFVFDEHKFENLTVGAGYRFSRTLINDYKAFNINGVPKGFNKVKPVEDQWEDGLHTFTAGIGWEFLDKQTLHFNFSHGGIQPRAGTVNEDLQMPTQETRIKYDLGWMGFFRGLGSATVTAFYVDQEDAIELTGQTMNIGGEILELYNNRKQYQYGVEGELRSIRFACGLQGFLNATWMETCYEEDDSDWARDLTMPRFIAGGGLNYVGHHFDASLFVRHVSGFENTRFLPSKSDPAPLGDYIDLGMTLGYSFGPYDNYRAHVRVENMTNDKYSNVVGYPDTGTRFYAGLTFKF